MVLRLTSTPLVHVPGVMLWLRTAWRTGDRDFVHTFIAAGWPMLEEEHILRLMDGDYTVEGETVVLQQQQ